MPHLIERVVRIITQPDREWAAIDRERASSLRILVGYLVPLALIASVAYGCAVLFFSAEGALHPSAADLDVRGALKLATRGFVAQLLGVAMTACVVYLVSPLQGAPRDFGAAFRAVAYACTPIWLAGVVLAAPLQRFPLLVVIILIAVMHSAFLLYLGLHHVVKVRRRDAAECAAIVVLASLFLSSIVGYAASAAGLF